MSNDTYSTRWPQRHRLTIAIDFDETFTADIPTWTTIILLLQQAGHTVICVSAVSELPGNRRMREQALPPGVKVLLSDWVQKRDFANFHGHIVDIWIDDCPEAIPNATEIALTHGRLLRATAPTYDRSGSTSPARNPDAVH